LEQAIWARSESGHRLDELVHHSDRGVQYVSIRYTERLAETGAANSVGSRGDSYDNALAETINGLYKTELIRNRGPLARPRRPRTRHARMGRLVQPPPPLRGPRPDPTSRVRSDPLPSNTLRPRGRNSNQTACMKPGAVHIAGARVVVPDLATQEAVLEATLSEFKANEATIAKDSRTTADDLGYRGLHVVVLLDGRYAEIQIRTALQGIWAQVVEKIDETSGSDLKHGSGPTETLRLLNTLSQDIQRVESGEADWKAVAGTLIAASIITFMKDRSGDE
jgi:Region found in RelA / SpoT proteins